MSKLFTTIVPSLLAGGLLFGSALTDAQPAPPAPPPPPSAAPVIVSPKVPKAPKPPKPPKMVKGQIHIDLGDLDEMVDDQIENALEAIADDDSIPPAVRDAVKQRLEKVRVKVKKRISKIGANDLEGLSEELGKMGEELGTEMEQFGKDMEKWGKQFEKDMEKKMKGKFVWKGGPHPNVHVDVDVDDPDFADMEDLADEMDDLDDAMKDLGSFKLAAPQRAALKKLRADSDARVANARRQLDAASEVLRTALENTSTSEQQIAQAIDNVSRLEADIRKARILAWVNARKLLDASQRTQVESAARGRSR
jgi:DNA repair exonuclease SbcCD ATPase subunit